jgi:hypothetical protein
LLSLSLGIDEQTANEAVARMNALSVGRRQEILDAAKISIRYRQALHLNAAFKDVVGKCNKYQTMPDVVSGLFFKFKFRFVQSTYSFLQSYIPISKSLVNQIFI